MITVQSDRVGQSAAAATGQARVPGTCGELLQGQFQSGLDFLVTLPVDRYAAVRVSLLDGVSGVQVRPAHKVKTRDAVQKTLDWFGAGEMGAMVRVTSQLPEGKGMASSTADIVAACRATAQALGQPLSSPDISQIAHTIEPTDGVMYPGVVCYDHRGCRLIERLGTLPPLQILVLDWGGEVDTQAFNRQSKAYTSVELAELARAYALLKIGLRGANLPLIGEAATISARINQRLLPRSGLEDVITLARKFGAYGVNVAHSGTVSGLLFDRGADRALRQARKALQASRPDLNCFVVNAITGREVES